MNVASLKLMHPDLDVKRLLGRLEAPVFGFDLHWMTQCHGAIELAALLTEVHPGALTIFGGISATYYADQLIGYPGKIERHRPRRAGTHTFRLRLHQMKTAEISSMVN